MGGAGTSNGSLEDTQYGVCNTERGAGVPLFEPSEAEKHPRRSGSGARRWMHTHIRLIDEGEQNHFRPTLGLIDPTSF
jgi:hypothetical protein